MKSTVGVFKSQNFAKSLLPYDRRFQIFTLVTLKIPSKTRPKPGQYPSNSQIRQKAIQCPQKIPFVRRLGLALAFSSQTMRKSAPVKRTRKIWLTNKPIHRTGAHTSTRSMVI